MEPTNSAVNSAPFACDEMVAPLNLMADNGVHLHVDVADQSAALTVTCEMLPECEHDEVLDAHGCDPSEYHWVPVLKKQRADSWSPEKQRKFIAALADTGSVRSAAKTVYMSWQSAYALRRSADAASFCAAWDAAISNAAKSLFDVAMDRALNGTEEILYNRDGFVTGYRTKFNDRLLMFMLRAHAPERYQNAHLDERREKQHDQLHDEHRSEETPMITARPMAEALARLDPVTPDEPYKLMAPDALEAALESADILDGKLPRWFRDRDILHEENMEAMANKGQSYGIPSVSEFLEKSKTDEPVAPVPQFKLNEAKAERLAAAIAASASKDYYDDPD